MAQSDPSSRDTASTPDSPSHSQQSLWRRIVFGRDKDNGGPGSSEGASKSQQGPEQQEDGKAGLIRRVSRKVVPGLPRAQTFKRQQSELRDNLEPIQPSPAERRAVSMDRRLHASSSAPQSQTQSNPRTSAPDFLHRSSFSAAPSVPSLPGSPTDDGMTDGLSDFNAPDEPRMEATYDDDGFVPPHVPDAISNCDAQSMTTSQYDTMIHDELERIWILNLSMHFRDKSKREKFFVTYRERETLWRRVTISLDYRNAPDSSLEMELVQTKFQRDKSAKIYEAIRESLVDIQFYDTVTNLKLQTTDGRLHVHVVEDVNEIISYPTVRMIQHMRCRRVKEREIEFDSHMSGFVYKVRVNDEVLIKKEIPGPDTVDEFLYEINALNRLRFANNVIQFYGVIVDDKEEIVKGLLISYAEQGALIDVLYDHDHSLPWPTRERWAGQIVSGLSEIHEAGFVQGDFTLSNIVINDEGDAKIIDINRRGCPVGWEPPEATPLIESNQRISMYIGVKSDLYQLGMVLWALATQEDEPEAHGRPLRIGSDVKVPAWYRRIVDICLSEDPRHRLQALQLLSMFPDPEIADTQYGHINGQAMSVDDGYPRNHDYFVEGFGVPTTNGNGVPRIKTVQPPNDWSYVNWGHPPFLNMNPGGSEDPFYYPPRGRSPPSPLPSSQGGCESPRFGRRIRSWSGNYHNALTAPSPSDVPPGGPREDYEDHDSKTNNVAAKEVHEIPSIVVNGEQKSDYGVVPETTKIEPSDVVESISYTRSSPAHDDKGLFEELDAIQASFQKRDGKKREETTAVASRRSKTEREASYIESILDNTLPPLRPHMTDPISKSTPGDDKAVAPPNGTLQADTSRSGTSKRESRLEVVKETKETIEATAPRETRVSRETTSQEAALPVNGEGVPAAVGPASEDIAPAAPTPSTSPAVQPQPSSHTKEPPPVPPVPAFTLPYDLKGIGLAYNFPSAHRHDTIMDDDFGLDTRETHTPQQDSQEPTTHRQTTETTVHKSE